MKKETIIKRSATTRRKGKTDWKRVRALSDGDINAAVRDDPDSELPKDFWKKAKLVTPENKVAISLRIDRDVLEHFKSEGGKYQTRMNAILRSYVDHKKRA